MNITLIVFLAGYLILAILVYFATIRTNGLTFEWPHASAALIAAVWPVFSIFVIYACFHNLHNASKCFWCGQVVQDGKKHPELIRDHILVCEKHPIHNEVWKLRDSRNQAIELLEADQGEWLGIESPYPPENVMALREVIAVLREEVEAQA